MTTLPSFLKAGEAKAACQDAIQLANASRKVQGANTPQRGYDLSLRQSPRQSLNERNFQRLNSRSNRLQRRVVRRHGESINPRRPISTYAHQLGVKFVEGELPRIRLQRQVLALTSAMPLCLNAWLHQQRHGRSSCQCNAGASRHPRVTLQSPIGSGAAAHKLHHVQSEVEPSVKALAKVVEPVAVSDIGHEFGLGHVRALLGTCHTREPHSVEMVQERAPAPGLAACALAEAAFSRRADRSSSPCNTPQNCICYLVIATIAASELPTNTEKGVFA